MIALCDLEAFSFEVALFISPSLSRHQKCRTKRREKGRIPKSPPVTDGSLYQSIRSVGMRIICYMPQQYNTIT